MRDEKTLLLDEIKDQINSYDSFIIMGYSGFTANSANEFRNVIAEQGGNVEMVPKRVLVKAAEESGLSLQREQLPGHISVVFAGQQPYETAKTVFKYSKDKGNVFTVLGGKFEGKLYAADDVEKLSKLPSLDEMRAQFVGLLEAPMAHTVSTMETLLSTIIVCLENKAKKEGQE